MIPKNTAKIMRFLLRNTESLGCNINQIAKSLDISAGSSFKILKDLEKARIVGLQNIGNAAFYNLDLNNPETRKLCEILLLEEKRNLKGYPKMYSESVQNFNNADLIVLFGSVLTKKDFNDVDVLFVTDKAKEVSSFCLDISKIRTKPVVPLIIRKKDLIFEIRKKKSAIISIVKEGIVLKGESVFVEVIRDAKN